LHGAQQGLYDRAETREGHQVPVIAGPLQILKQGAAVVRGGRRLELGDLGSRLAPNDLRLELGDLGLDNSTRRALGLRLKQALDNSRRSGLGLRLEQALDSSRRSGLGLYCRRWSGLGLYCSRRSGLGLNAPAHGVKCIGQGDRVVGLLTRGQRNNPDHPREGEGLRVGEKPGRRGGRTIGRQRDRVLFVALRVVALGLTDALARWLVRDGLAHFVASARWLGRDGLAHFVASARWLGRNGLALFVASARWLVRDGLAHFVASARWLGREVVVVHFFVFHLAVFRIQVVICIRIV